MKEIERTPLSSKALIEMKDCFLKCLKAEYIHVDNDGDYAFEESRDGKTLYLLFQCTRTAYDWISNFDFVAKPYKDMEITWRCHRGFLRVWKSIKPHIEELVKNEKYKTIKIVGFSHGAAIATLAHEYVWFNRPDLRSKENPDGITGYGFGCPRCYFGSILPWKKMPQELAQRWERFYPIRNLTDIVTHVPPVLFGFRHVNKVIKIGTEIHYKDERHPKRRKCILAHYSENYIFSLEQKHKDQSK